MTVIAKYRKLTGMTLKDPAFRMLFSSVFTLISIASNCQNVVENDIVRISEVIIRAKKLENQLFYKGVQLDSSALMLSWNRSLADLISENTNISFKSYGNGGSATISIRGTGAGHTRLEWNGISINHPMLGQADFSLVPVFAVDNVDILTGSSSMLRSNGGIGGIINLESKPLWKDNTSVSVSTATGSLGNYSGAVSVRTGNLKFQSSTKAFAYGAENDFRYLDNVTDAVSSWQRMDENRVGSNGIIQEFYCRSSTSLFSARIWYQSTRRELPSPMLSRQPGLHEKQYDETFRSMLSYSAKSGNNDFSLTGAWVTNRLDYTNNLASINSRNNSGTFTAKAGIENNSFTDIKLRVFIDEELNKVRSNNYHETRLRNIASLTTAAEKLFFERLVATVLVREIIDNEILLVPDFSLGIQYRISEMNDYFLKATIARNSKMPSLNDLYWYPGGNSNLKNEYANQFELSYDMTRKIESWLSLNFDFSAFRYNIRDMVLWHPGEFSYWVAENIQNVNSTGLETSFKVSYSNHDVTALINAGYSFTKSVSDSEGTFKTNNQLAYIPVNQAYVTANASYGKFYASWNCNLTGKRYITSDNSGYLQAYLLNNITTGIKLSGKEKSVDLSFRIDNIFNQNYQAIAHYPMPGRTYFLSLTVNISK